MPLPKLAILLCTYNGAAFLQQQLDSFVAQTLQDFVVIASDDGSTDATLEILRHAAAGALAGRLQIVDGPRTGVNDNFLSFFEMPTPPARFMAYADQDDIWDPDKLERAARWLELQEARIPALYGTRSRLIDSQGKFIGMSPHFKRPAQFGNALVQSMFGGNTMVFNDAAWQVLKASRPAAVVAHDWWTYIAVTAVGGNVRYEAAPSLSYRQHERNLVGARANLQTRLERFWTRRFQRWNSQNEAAMATLLPSMTNETRTMFAHWQKARARPPLMGLLWLARSKVYRQSFLGNLGLWLATLMSRI